MRNMVVVAYRPKPGCEAALTELVKEHVPRLRRLGLATDRPASAGIGEGGTIVEIFEWREGAIAAAHDDPAVRAMWNEFAAVCDYTPLQALPEAGELFAAFTALDLAL